MSLVRLLEASFAEDEPVPGAQCRAALVRTEDFKQDQSSTLLVPPALSIYLYRVDFNKTMRASWAATGYRKERAILPLDLHYLMTAWAANAEYEQRIMGRAMQSLESCPILSGPLLHPPQDWAPGQGIQLLLEDIATEALMRVFDSLPGEYKLSVPYLARVVLLEGPPQGPTPPVETVIDALNPRRTR